MKSILPLLILGVVSSAFAQTIELVKDINTYPNSSGPIFDAAATPTKLFFRRSEPSTGDELWVSDLVTGQTALVKDIHPGATGSNVRWITPAFGDTVIFSADDGVHDAEPWVSDGTAAGTRMLEDINPNGSSFPYEFGFSAGFLTFGADDGVHGTELWTTDSTYSAAATKLLFDLNPGPEGSDPAEVISLGTITSVDFDLFLRAKVSNALGYELVKIPFVLLGGGFQTPQVFNLNPSGDSFPALLTRVSSNRFFFTANDGATGHELWVSNGSPPGPGTYRVQDFSPGATETLFSSIRAVGNRVIFTALGQPIGDEVFSSDGTPNGIVSLDIVPGSESSSPQDFVALGGNLFFTARTASGREIWKTNGISFSQVANIAAGAASSEPFGLINFAGAVYFLADDNISGRELWRTDGLSTSLVKDIFPGTPGCNPGLLFSNGAALLFSANAATNTFLWKSDGTTLGTTPVGNLTLPGTLGSSPSRFFEAGGKLLFDAVTAEFGTELWVTDGTSQGTALFTELAPGNRAFHGFQPVGKLGLFQRTDPNGETLLWRTDGTPTGTAPISSARVLSTTLGVADLGGSTFFSGSLTNANFELFRSDGTAAGTSQVKDIRVGPTGSDPLDFARFGNRFLFSADDGIVGREPWISDGTNAGTVLLKNINPAAGSSPRNFTEANGKAVFSAFEPGTGVELYVTDGTEGGTSLLSNIAPNALGSSPSDFRRLNNFVIFRATPTGNDADPKALFRTDGTFAGTSQIVVSAFPGFTVESVLAAINGKMFFVATDSVNGREPWVTDGTSAGTFILKDINPGLLGSNPTRATEVSGRLFFSANTATNGRELWATDGTPSGTALVGEVNSTVVNGDGGPLALSSNPDQLYAYRGTLFFSASPPLDTELYKVTVDACPDDSAKVAPGVCGCGSVDSDLNANSVIDCLKTPELRTRLDILAGLVRTLKSARSASAKRKAKQLKKKILAALADVQGFATQNVAGISVSGGFDLTGAIRAVAKKTKKALTLGGTLAKDRKSALAALQSTRAKLVG